MRAITLFAFVSSVLLLSCKKKEPLQASTCPTLDPNTYNGSCWTQVSTSNLGNGGNNPMTTVTFVGRFWKVPTVLVCNDIAGAQITVNGNSLKYVENADCQSYYYFNQPNGNVSNEDHWTFSGPDMPYFNGINRDPLPSYSPLNLIPDTVSKKSGVTFTLTAANFNVGQLTLSDSTSGAFTNHLDFTLTPGPNVISVTPSQLSAWATGTTGCVSISMNNISIVNACSRNYRFVKSVNVTKKLTIKP